MYQGYPLPVLFLLFISLWGGIIHALTARDGALPTDLGTALLSSTWIWTPETSPPNAPPEPRAFRRTFTNPTGKTATNALVLLTVDNYFSLYVDGQQHYVGTPADPSQSSWQYPVLFNVPMTSSSTLFAILGVNQNDASNALTAAGLLAAVKVMFSDGTSSIFTSDINWSAAKNFTDGWEKPSTSEPWDPASIVAQYGASGSPWGNQIILPSSFATDPLAYTTPSSSTPPTSTTTTSSSLSATSTSNHNSVTLSHGAIVGIACGAAVIILLLLATAVALWRFGFMGHLRQRGAGEKRSSVIPWTDDQAPDTFASAYPGQALETYQLIASTKIAQPQSFPGHRPQSQYPDDAPPIYEDSFATPSGSISAPSSSNSALLRTGGPRQSKSGAYVRNA